MTPLKAIGPGLWTRGIPDRLALTDFKLIAFDMDATLINIECIDEIAGMVGLQAQVSAITEAAMRGDIADYKDSLRQRVALLKGTPFSVLQRVFDEKMQLNPGVRRLVSQCLESGLHTLIVSGGFDYFALKLQEMLGIHASRSNCLEVHEGCLTGRLVPQSWGDICDGETKKRTVMETAKRLNIKLSECIAVGDGSNDLPMMSVCGLSVGYQAKPKVRDTANIVIDHGGLDRLLDIATV